MVHVESQIGDCGCQRKGGLEFGNSGVGWPGMLWILRVWPFAEYPCPSLFKVLGLRVLVY